MSYEALVEAVSEIDHDDYKICYHPEWMGQKKVWFEKDNERRVTLENRGSGITIELLFRETDETAVGRIFTSENNIMGLMRDELKFSDSLYKEFGDNYRKLVVTPQTSFEDMAEFIREIMN